MNTHPLPPFTPTTDEPSPLLPPRKSHHAKPRPVVESVPPSPTGSHLRADDGPSLTTFLSSAPAVWRDRYEKIPIDRAIDELGLLRRISEMAAEVINRRTVPVEDKCHICGEKIPFNKAPVQRIAWRDHATGLDMGASICSVNCVREFNRKKMGMAELVK